MCIVRSTLFWPSEVRDTVVARVCVEEAWPHGCSIGWISGVQKREGRQQNPLTASLAGPLNLLVCELFPHFLHLLTAARRHKVRNGHRLQAAPSTRVFHRHTWAPLQKCNLHSYPGSLLTGYSDLIFCPMALGCSMMQQAWGWWALPSTKPTVGWLQTPPSTLHKYSESVQMLARQAFCTVWCSRGQENAP